AKPICGENMAAVSATLLQHLRDDLERIVRKWFGLGDALKSSLCNSASLRLERLPASERRKHPGRYLRVEFVEFEHPVGDEVVTPAVRAIEVDRIPHGEGSDQRTHLVGVFDRE